MAFILTKKIVIAIGAVAALAVTGLGINYVAMPTIDNIALSQEAVDSAETEVADMQTRLSGLQTSQAQFPIIRGIDEDLEAQFPSTVEESLLQEIINGSGSSGATVKSVEFTPPAIVIPDGAAADPNAAVPADGAVTETPADATAPADGTVPADGTATTPETGFGDGFAEVSFSLVFEGSPQQIQGFLSYLNTTSRAIVISQVSFTEESPGTVTASLTGKAYLSRLINIPAEPGTEPAVTEESDEVVVVEDGSEG